MSWIKPLGFLGLLGIAVLILIYILKPNYQQKVISSTFVWKLSLKYKKKKLPTSRMRNILIFLCQLLIIVLCASILAQPIIHAEQEEYHSEKIAIIDASANMLAAYDNETRFERAVAQVKALAQEVTAQEGDITVILADSEPSMVVERSGADQLGEILQKLDALVVPNDLKCSFGTADLNSAVSLAEKRLAEIPDAEVLLYTATEYYDKGNITVVDMKRPGEWNAAILDCRVSLKDNYYAFSADIASYGKDITTMLYCDVFGANAEKMNLSYRTTVTCDGDEMQTVTFDIDNSDIGVYSYDYVHFYLEEADSFSYDNSAYLYGGTKQTIRVQYYSSLPNDFFGGALMTLRSGLSSRWNIELTEVKPGGTPALEGFDFYIFEHNMPQTLPTDGVVLLTDPAQNADGLGIVYGDGVYGDFYLASGQQHPVTNFITAENISVSAYRRVITSDGYEPLIYCGGDPVFLLKDDPSAKVAVMAFSLNRSNLSVLLDFPALMYNLFEYFIPSTVTNYLFEVGESVSLNARGPVLTVDGPDMNVDFESFPGEIKLTVPGMYTLSQVPMSGNEVVENFYVKIPASESNIFPESESLPVTRVSSSKGLADLDLLVYFAAALIFLLFAEWWLQSREQF